MSSFPSRFLRGQKSSLPPLWVFLVALLARVTFVLTLDNKLYWPDEIAFNQIALNLLNGEGYQSSAFRANPVLAWFLALIYKLFGYGYLVPRIVQSVIGTITACIVYSLSIHLFHRRVAILASLGVALYPPFIYSAGVFYVSALETFLITLSMYLLYLGSQEERGSFLFLTLSGLTMGIAALCRPVSFALIPFAALFIVLAYRGGAVRRCVCVTILLGVSALSLVPWTVRNYAIYDRLLLVSTGGGEFLWKGNNELARGDSFDRYLEPGHGEVWLDRLRALAPGERNALIQKYQFISRDLESLDEIERDRYLQKVALEFIARRPDQFADLFAKKVRTLYTAFTQVRAENEKLITRNVRSAFSAIFYPILLFAFVGMLATLKEWRRYLALYLPIVSLTLAYGVLAAAARFRMPLEPFLIMFASHAFILFWQALRGIPILLMLREVKQSR